MTACRLWMRVATAVEVKSQQRRPSAIHTHATATWRTSLFSIVQTLIVLATAREHVVKRRPSAIHTHATATWRTSLISIVQTLIVLATAREHVVKKPGQTVKPVPTTRIFSILAMMIVLITRSGMTIIRICLITTLKLMGHAHMPITRQTMTACRLWMRVATAAEVKSQQITIYRSQLNCP